MEIIDSGVVSNPQSGSEVWKRRSSLLLRFVGAQTLVQLMSLCVGFLLVRTLTLTEYALFTLANTMQGSIAILSDSGVGSAMSAIGGRVWNNNHRLGQLIQAGLKFRRGLILFYGTSIIPFLAWMLIKNGSGWASALWICGVVIVGVQFQLTSGVLQVVPRMQSRLDQLQKTDLYVGGFRLVLVAIACLVWANAETSIFIATVGFGLQCYLLKRWVRQSVNIDSSVVEEDWQAIKKSVRELTPTSLFYCFQGQLTIFLLSIFGDTHNVAEVGALGRLSVVFAIFGSVMTNVLYPRFARCQDPRVLVRLYWQILGVNMGFGLIILTLAYCFPNLLLWTLGQKYAGLQSELFFVMFNAVVLLMGGVVSTLNNERSWTKGTWTCIPIIIASQMLMLPFVNLSSTRDVLLLGSLPYFVGLLPFFYRAQQGLQNFRVNNRNDVELRPG